MPRPTSHSPTLGKWCESCVKRFDARWMTEIATMKQRNCICDAKPRVHMHRCMRNRTRKKRWRIRGWICFDIQISIVRKDDLNLLFYMWLLFTASFHLSVHQRLAREWRAPCKRRTKISPSSFVRCIRLEYVESDRWSRIYQKKINVINTEKSGRGGFFWTAVLCWLRFGPCEFAGWTSPIWVSRFIPSNHSYYSTDCFWKSGEAPPFPSYDWESENPMWKNCLPFIRIQFLQNRFTNRRTNK